MPAPGEEIDDTPAGGGTNRLHRDARDRAAVSGEIPTDVGDRRLLLAVPNVSEGRDRDTVTAIGRAYSAGGARLLDAHVDPDHHRAVHTLAGVPGTLGHALAAGAEQAIRRIDLRTPRGVHPHVGALDVCPVVHLDEARRGAAVLEALTAAEEIGRLGVPVLLYGDLGDGRTRAELRRGGPAALAERLLTGELRPDFGPRRSHDTAGAVLVGVRPPLIAFNLELAAPATVEDARRIAGLIRASGAEGLPGVRAIGLRLDRPDGLAAVTGIPIAQVSCNVEDHREVPLGRLVAAVARHAEVAACEVIGLPPAEAFVDFPDDMAVRGRRTLEDALAHGRDGY